MTEVLWKSCGLPIPLYFKGVAQQVSRVNLDFAISRIWTWRNLVPSTSRVIRCVLLMCYALAQRNPDLYPDALVLFRSVQHGLDTMKESLMSYPQHWQTFEQVETTLRKQCFDMHMELSLHAPLIV